MSLTSLLATLTGQSPHQYATLQDLLSGLIAAHDLTTTEIAGATVNPDVGTIRTTGWSEPADGGGGLFFRSASPPNHPNFHQSLDGAYWILDTTCGIKAKQVGVTLDGSTDDTAALRNAVSIVGTTVYFPAGRMVLTGTVTTARSVSLLGAGMGKTTFDFSSAVAAGLIDNRLLRTPTGTLTSLPALSVAPKKGEKTLTFASAPPLVYDDVICLFDPTNKSYSGHNDIFRKSEYARVALVEGNVVTLQGSVADSYSTSIDLYRMDDLSELVWDGFNVVGSDDVSAEIPNIDLHSCRDSRIRNVKSSGGGYAGCVVRFADSVVLEHCHMGDDQKALGSDLDYGLIVGGCHKVHVLGGRYTAGRHGITGGGDGLTGQPIDRYHLFDGAFIGTSGKGGVPAFDMHGNAEHYTVVNCPIDGSMNLGGDWITVSTNTVKALPGVPAFQFADMAGFNFAIRDNVVECFESVSSRGSVMDIGGNSAVYTIDTFRGGLGVFEDNKVTQAAVDGVSFTNSAVVLNARAVASANPASVSFDGNVMTLTNENARWANGISVILSNDASDNEPSPFESISFSSNILTRMGGIRVVRTIEDGQSGAQPYTARKITSKANRIYSPASYGIDLQGGSVLVTSDADTVDDSGGFPMRLEGADGSNRCKVIQAAKAILINGFSRADTDDGGTQAGLIINHSDYAADRGTTTGSPNKRIRVDSVTGLQVGETITGGTSAATAVVQGVSDESSKYILIGETETGTFQSGETITGGTSAVSVTSQSAAIDGQTFSGSYTNVTKLGRGGLFDIDSSASITKTSVGQEVAI